MVSIGPGCRPPRSSYCGSSRWAGTVSPAATPMAGSFSMENPWSSRMRRDPVTHGQFELTVPDGRIFVLGDERDRARDSRVLLTEGASGTAGDVAVRATLPANARLGRVLTVIVPPWQLHHVSAGGGASLHYLVLAAVGIGLALFLAGACMQGHLLIVSRGKRDPS